MKNIVSLFIGLAITVSSFAQLTEGKITYSLDFSSPDPQMQAQFTMLKGSTMAMYFSPEFTRTEMNMGMFVQTSTVVDIKGQEATMLMSGMPGKKATKMSTKPKEEEKAEVEVEKTKETKKIAGYKCTKFIITTEEGALLNMWVTEELVASKEGNRFLSDKITGVPLEFEIAAEGMTMTFTATAVEKTLKAYNKKDIFSMEIPSDYELINPEDWKGMM